MYCSIHPQEQIKCLNINPEMSQNRLICFDCYIQQISLQVPQKYLVKISEVTRYIFQILNNPKLLFIERNQSQCIPDVTFGYDKFILVENFLKRKVDIVTSISEIKTLFYDSVITLFEWLDEYSAEVQSCWDEAQQLQDYVWEKINYKQNEENLKSILTNGSNYKVNEIIENLNKMFQDLKVDNNPEFNEMFTKLTQRESQQKNQDIIHIWKAHLNPLKKALQNFIGTHNTVYASTIIKFSRFKNSNQPAFQHQPIIINHEKLKQSFAQCLPKFNPDLMHHVYDLIKDDIKSNFCLEIDRFYTNNFNSLDLANQNSALLVILLDNQKNQSHIGFYVPQKDQGKAIVFQTTENKIYQQTKNTEKIVLRKNLQKNQCVFSICEDFITINQDGLVELNKQQQNLQEIPLNNKSVQLNVAGKQQNNLSQSQNIQASNTLKISQPFHIQPCQFTQIQAVPPQQQIQLVQTTYQFTTPEISVYRIRLN